MKVRYFNWFKIVRTKLELFNQEQETNKAITINTCQI